MRYQNSTEYYYINPLFFCYSPEVRQAIKSLPSNQNLQDMGNFEDF